MSRAAELVVQALEQVRHLRERCADHDDAELRALLAELQLTLGDLQTAQATGAPSYRDGAYWWQDEGPYCVECWDDRGQQRHLRPVEGSLAGMGRWQCSACNIIVR